MYQAPAFQSTPSEGRATNRLTVTAGNEEISIHALRGEGDQFCDTPYFNALVFQSTPSEGRATSAARVVNFLLRFQSTPSEGRATPVNDVINRKTQFQSTPSEGRATLCGPLCDSVSAISIHALRGEGDQGTG